MVWRSSKDILSFLKHQKCFASDFQLYFHSIFQCSDAQYHRKLFAFDWITFLFFVIFISWYIMVYIEQPRHLFHFVSTLYLGNLSRNCLEIKSNWPQLVKGYLHVLDITGLPTQLIQTQHKKQSDNFCINPLSENKEIPACIDFPAWTWKNGGCLQRLFCNQIACSQREYVLRIKLQSNQPIITNKCESSHSG